MEERTRTLAEISTTISSNKDLLAVMYGADHPEYTWVLDLLSSYFEKASVEEEKGAPLAWVNFGVPAELFWAMDIFPLVIDITTGMTAPSPWAVKYIDIAEAQVPGYLCANNKVLMGAALAGDLKPPLIFVHPSQPCDSNLATYPIMAEHFGFPYFCIDMPYFRSEQSAPYVARELEKLIAVLEDLTGRKLDLDRLREVMEYSNQAHEYILKIAKLREAVPSPYSSVEAISEYGIILTLSGRPELVDYLRRRYELTKERVAKGEGYFTKEQEKLRLVWIYGSVAFDPTVFMWLEMTYGAVSVANMNNNFIMNPVEDLSSRESILRGLAEKIVLLPMTRECGGPWENYLNATIDLLRRFKADAAIFAGHVACKSNWAIAKLVKDKIDESVGIPTLNLEVDIFDPRVASAEAIKATFEEFFQVNFPEVSVSRPQLPV